MTIDARAHALVYAFRRNLVVAASAGTGKTHRLTGLYAMLALGLSSSGQASDDETAPPVLPSRIVATTFSRAAAREIADRVASSLAGVARDGAELGRHAAAIEARLSVLRDPPSREVLRARARLALADLPSARIDTVHGLAARLVVEHAVELGLPPGARILDEGESAELDALVVDEALHAALDAGGHAADAARALLETCGGLAPTRVEVAALLARLDEEGSGPDELERGDHVAAADRLRRATREVAAWVAREGTEKLRAPARRADEALARFADGSIDPAALEEALVDLFGATVSRKNAANEALADLREALGRGTNAERGLALAQLLVHAPALAAREELLVELLVDARARLRRERDARRALSFGDVLRIARDGLRDRPTIAARARGSIEALLVDEFQDTSPVQRDLVLLLRERPDAARARGPGQAPETGGLAASGLFLVGDRKQSIYGFRGADVAVFARLCAELGGRAAAEALELPAGLAREPAIADFVALRASHRSGPRLCAFVNEVAVADFGAGGATADFEVRYGAAERLVSAVSRPHDEVLVARDDGRALEGADPFVATARGPLRAALAAAAIVDGELLPAHPARDVAVLARRRSTIPLVELALHRRGIPYVVAGRALFDAVEVRDLAALLRLILDPRERRALATVLRGPAASLSDDALLALSTPGRGLDAERVFSRASSDDDALLPADDRARLVAFRERFAAARPALLRMTPADAVREAVRSFELDVALAALPRAAARIGNLGSIEALARGRGGGLAAFSRHLEALIASETDGEEAVVFSDDDDAVRVTTIHASKGLDFAAVVLLDLEASTAPRSPGLGVGRVGPRMRLLVRHRGRAGGRIAAPVLADAEEELKAREQAERRRLSYVGLTRARDRLVLVLPGEGDEKKPRAGSLHATLSGLGAELEPLVTRALDAPALLEARGSDRPRVVTAETAVAPDRPRRAPMATIGLATTPLGTFRECPRRFRLRHLLGFDEPVASSQLELFELPVHEAPDDPAGDESPALDEHDDAAGAPPTGGDPRTLGRAAHRVLETWPLAAWGVAPPLDDVATRLAAEGLAPFATRQLAPGLAAFLGSRFAHRAASARVERERAFVLHVGGGDGRPALELRGAVDLLVVDDGDAFVVDYKVASPAKDLAAWEFQLRTYALAARAMEGVERVAAGVVFLRGGAAEPRWLGAEATGGMLTAEDHAAHERDLAALAARFAAARWDDRWDGVPRARCDALRCGFVTACHGKARRPG